MKSLIQAAKTTISQQKTTLCRGPLSSPPLSHLAYGGRGATPSARPKGRKPIEFTRISAQGGEVFKACFRSSPELANAASMMSHADTAR